MEYSEYNIKTNNGGTLTMPKSRFFAMILCAMLFIIANKTIAQETNKPSDENFVDSIDYREDLLDSNIAYKQKFDSLSKSGEWVEVKKADIIKEINAADENATDNDYDESSSSTTVIYVFRPYPGASEFNPYSNGRWEFTYYGWVWVSDYSFGWACYNYGRWYYSNFYGWVWLPGSYWAPNWVSWRSYGSYCGWYPICPRFRWRNHHGNYCRNYTYISKPRNWVFCDMRDFKKKIDPTVVVDPVKNNEILKNSSKTMEVNTSKTAGVKIKYTGPDVNIISKYTGVVNTPKEVNITKNTTKVRDENVAVRNTENGPKSNPRNNTTTKDPNGSNNTTKDPNVRGDNNTKYNPPKSDGPKNPPRNDGPRTSPPRNDGPKNNPPRNDGPKNNPPPKNDGPKHNAPKSDGPKSNGPKTGK